MELSLERAYCILQTRFTLDLPHTFGHIQMQNYRWRFNELLVLGGTLALLEETSGELALVSIQNISIRLLMLPGNFALAAIYNFIFYDLIK